MSDKKILGADGRPANGSNGNGNGQGNDSDQAGKEVNPLHVKTVVTDPRRMSTGLMIFNLVRMAEAEVYYTRQLEAAALIKMQQRKVGDLPGEQQINQALDDVSARRMILIQALDDRFKDQDRFYWERIGVQPLDSEVGDKADIEGSES